MIVIAALLLPGLCVLLLLLDHVENWLSAPVSGPRHARARRRLRSVAGEAHATVPGSASGSAPESAARGAHAA
ncbi:hypothetical protein ABZZ79_07815 [Streptomyces sp. NPDC006458]|uniref:hypothetical protein n=1 Tax=Streptomyces sp. NPDC006458 TaxID=3154302 RepID=UPI0033B4B9B1